MSTIRLHRPSEGVALIELARPEVLNALDAATNRALLGHLEQLEEAGEVRVVVLAGEGRAFSAGADLGHMRGLSGPALRRFIEASRRPADRLACSPLISVAALHGHVLGGGAELALGCDIRIAAPSLSFGFPEMGLGSLPGSGGMQRLPQIVGHARALELVALGQRLGAEEALDLGLVTRLASADGSLRDEALALAAAIAARPAESLRYAKAAMTLAGLPEAAGAFHGLVSATRQADPAYRSKTAAFDREDGQGT
ncbi:enoyl-CoA hydratase/isomerase family protein [Cereibacter azotoformans]|uniref:enoyl-CoA hydratase/isomerase family protein n=1 Tax=Cereibacter azotoformans TaxID=43057 RepID=UPI000C6E2394|nr:enoyl-CoA hydratase/isomerase family protein [Cereibacter azotoformans]